MFVDFKMLRHLKKKKKEVRIHIHFNCTALWLLSYTIFHIVNILFSQATNGQQSLIF